MSRDVSPQTLVSPSPSHVAGPGLVIAALLLASCAWNDPPVPRADSAVVSRYRAGGYAPGTALSVGSQTFVSAPTESRPWSVTLFRPDTHAPSPVIVFLPPLGERDSTPNAWVGSWAGAGYAVLVVQPLAEDADAWSSDQARRGDFALVARTRFAPELLPARIERLAFILRQLRERAAGGAAGLEDLDWAQVGIAGADLGALAVQGLAAMSPEARRALGLPFEPAAYLAISPIAPRSAEDTPTAGAAPVLVASAANDVDDYGVVTDPAVRRLAFDRFPASDGFYLEIESASHRWMAGHAETPPPLEQPRRPAAAGDSQQDPRKKGRNAAAARRDNVAPENEEPEDAAAVARNRALHEQAIKARAAALTRAALSQGSFEAVSAAFWDYALRQSVPARDWLVNAAPRWLAPGDRLKHRQ